MSKVYCYNCFQELDEGTVGSCPHCGYHPKQDEGKYPLALPQGSVLNGQYIMGRVLGQGGFGVTYLSLDWKSGQRVAVKEYLPDTMATRINGNMVTAYSGQRGESFIYGKECFLEEAKTLAEFIGNPNIVRVHRYFEENGTAYFVMDYIEGISLENYIKRHGGKIGWQEAEYFLFPVMDALDAVHSRGIIHRDVTPDNIFITGDGTVKLLDFGAARYSIGDRSRSLDVVLKHGFAPKEQYTRHGRQGPYTDVYTVAATLYYTITGRKPPDSIDRLEEDDLIPPSSLGIAIPNEVEDAILKGMGVQPGDRYQRMAEFKRALTVQPEVPITQPQMPPSQPEVPITQPQMPPSQPEISTTQSQMPVTETETGNGTVALPENTEMGAEKALPVGSKRKWLLPAGIGGIAVILVLAVFLIKAVVPSSGTSGTGGGGGGTVAGNFGGTSSEGDADRLSDVFAGNRIGNVSNCGLAVEDSNYKYYATENILRVNKKTGKSDILCELRGESLNLYADALYFLFSGSVYRISTAGGDSQLVLDGRETGYKNMYVTDDGTAYLYTKKSSLLRADISSWEMEEVVSGIWTDDFTVDGDWVYYRSAKDKKFYKIKTDGSKNKKINDAYCFDPIAEDGWIYVNNFDSIKKVAADGAQEELIYDNTLSGDIYGMNLIDDTIYFYVDGDDMKEAIYSIKTDGSGLEKIFEVSSIEDRIYNVNLLEGEVLAQYYSAENKNLSLVAIVIGN